MIVKTVFSGLIALGLQRMRVNLEKSNGR